MIHANQAIIQQFYAAFQQRDYKTMQNLYHPEAEFQDPVFQQLTSSEVKAMWQMLLSGAKDLTVTFCNVEAGESTGSCLWEAHYAFSQTGRNVHNKIKAVFEFKDDKIFRHIDTFDLWRWSRMALGTPGVLMGWSPLVRNKIRRSAQDKLKTFMTRLGTQ